MEFNEKTEAGLTEIAKDIIRNLDGFAKSVDVYEYGLPTGMDFSEEEMLRIVLEQLRKVAGMFHWTA